MNTLQAKVDAAVRFALGFLVMLVGFALARTGALAIAGVVAAVFGASLAARSFGRLVRIVGLEQQMRGVGQEAEGFDSAAFAGGAWRRASLPRRIFWLLYAVAEVDGRSGAREIDLVRRFLLERFLSPDVLRDLATWNAPRFPPGLLPRLVESIRREVSDSECEVLFEWCSCIALIDEKFTSSEHDLLQTISRGLGMPALHAQHLFRRAKARVIQATTAGGGGFGGGGFGGGGFAGAGGGFGGGSGRSAGGRTWTNGARPSPDRRRQALDVLGLDASADEQAIRKRHRELVKRYHPDAHASLGEVAAREASERFKEVQAAYEYLVGKR